MSGEHRPDRDEKDRLQVNHEGRKAMKDAVRLRQQRHAQWEQEGERPLWKNLSMIGMLGWLMVTPVLLGVVAGRWLDARLGTGIQFSGTLIFLGACVGFYLVCRRMNQK